MRYYLFAALAMSSGASAQTAANPQAARQSLAPVVTSEDTGASTMAPEDSAGAPAARGREGRILSQNEIYNLGRKAEGRVGIRVGNDMSFRIEKKAGAQ